MTSYVVRLNRTNKFGWRDMILIVLAVAGSLDYFLDKVLGIFLMSLAILTCVLVKGFEVITTKK